MTWNESSQVWEVAIRLHPLDLENAMSVGAPKRRSIEDDDFPKQTMEYLKNQFFVVQAPKDLAEIDIQKQIAAPETKETTPTEKPVAPWLSENHRSTLEWVGMEQERGWLWIYVEMKFPKPNPDQSKLWFVNRLLIDHVDKQENSLLLDSVTKPKYSLQFKKDEWVKALKN